MFSYKLHCINIVPVRHLLVLASLAIISALTPFISFWGLSKVIDAVSGASSGTNIILYIILMGFFLVTNDTFEAIRWTYSTFLEGKIFLEMKEKLLSKVAHWKYIDIFENPNFLNKLNFADQSIPRFHGFFNSLAMLTSGVLGSLPFLWIGFTTRWWIPFAIIFGFLPSLIIKWNLEERLWALEIQNGEEYKEAGVQESMLLGQAFAKEIRLWNIASFILNKWKKNRQSLLAESSALRNKSMVSTLLANLFEGTADCAVIAYLYFMISRGELTSGEFVFAVTAVIQLRQNAFTVLLFGLDIKVAFDRLKPFFEILNYEDIKEKSSVNISSQHKDIQHKDIQNEYIALKNVSFVYPDCTIKALDNINFSVREKEKVAIVGANGSGKSTLVKLISGMYPVETGEYFFAGKRTCEIPYEEFRKIFSAVFQDFAKFPMSFEENVVTADLEKVSLSASTCSIDKAKFDSLCNRFPIKNKLLNSSSLLTRQFENGLDLSGGEWQRIALMRCAWADRDVVLLDEPTAALDPDSEYEVLEAMLNVIKDKTAIIVTHRLALCKKADRIIVMDSGRIIEEGQHNELMHKRGRYAEMYNKQGEHYRGDTDTNA